MDKEKVLVNKGGRWDHYFLIKGEEIHPFWEKHLLLNPSRSLYILGSGFDARMNIGIEKIINASPLASIDTMLIHFSEGEKSSSLEYLPYVDKNLNELYSILGSRTLVEKKIQMWEGSGRKKRRVGDRRANELFKKKEDIENYNNIILDISALPRGIYFSLIGKLLSLLDEYFSNQQINFFVVTAENAELDAKIIENGVDEDLYYPLGFGGGLDLESQNLPIVWIPLLGENKSHHLEKANQHIKPSEICPILPFPSKNPRRSDNIFKEHHELLFDTYRIETQNMMYVPEQNPFEVYKSLMNTIKTYNDSLSILGGSNAVITPLSSKLLSIGALLAAYEIKKDNKYQAGILNVNSQGYEIKEINKMEKFKNDSELFVTWLTGIPYM